EARACGRGQDAVQVVALVAAGALAVPDPAADEGAGVVVGIGVAHAEARPGGVERHPAADDRGRVRPLRETPTRGDSAPAVADDHGGREGPDDVDHAVGRAVVAGGAAPPLEAQRIAVGIRSVSAEALAAARVAAAAAVHLDLGSAIALQADRPRLRAGG